MRAHCWLRFKRHAPSRRWDGHMYRWAECGDCGRRYATHVIGDLGPF